MKKIVSILMLLLIVLGNVPYVYAEAITPEAVAKKLDENLENVRNILNIGSASLEGNKIVVKVISEEQMEETLMEFDVSGQEISANIDVPDDDDYEKAFEALFKITVVRSLIESVAELKGYTERDCRTFLLDNSEDADSILLKDITYEKNGVSFEKQEKKMTFKINLDTFKIDLAYIEGPKPEIVIEEVTENEITYSAKGDIEPGTNIELYRSTDGINFEYSMSFAYQDEQNMVYANDTDLQPNTTYYYKAVVEKSSVFSEVVAVKTLSNENEEPIVETPTDNEQEEDKIDNPKTGSENNVIYIIGGLSIIGLLTYFIHRKNKIYNI